MAEIDHLGPRAETAIKIAGITGMVGGLVAGCEQKPQVDPTGNATEPVPGETMAPPVTEAPVSTTGTPIVEATPAIPEMTVDELVNGFELKSQPGYENRTFAFEERDGITYLVDQFNNAPKAVRAEDGSWRELDWTNAADAEVMYGGLVQSGSYIDKEITNRSDGVSLHSLNSIYSGDYDYVETTNGFTVPYLRIAFRSDDGVLSLARFAFDATGGGEPDHWLSVLCDGNVKRFTFGYDEVLRRLIPGQKLDISVYEPTSTRLSVPPLKYWTSQAQSPLGNNAQVRIFAMLYNGDSDGKIASPDWNNLENGEWPDETINLYGNLQQISPCSIPLE